MHNTRDPSDHFVDIRGFWSVIDQQTFSCTITDDYYDDEDVVTEVTYEQLASHHPLLPICITEKCHYERINNGENQAYVTGSDAYAMVMILKGACLSFIDETGDDLVMISIANISPVKGNDKLISLKGIGCGITYVDHNDCTLPLVKDSQWKSHFVTREYLDSAYPGWENRLSVGTNLGLAVHELATYVFTATSEQRVAVDTITFE